MPRLRRLPVAAALLLLTACTVLTRQPPLPPLPAPLTLEVVTAIDRDGPFTVDPSATRLALARSGLVVHDLNSGDAQRLDRDEPLALAWSPDGTRLAAAFADGAGSRLQLFNDRAGLVPGPDIRLPGRIASLQWRDAATLTLVAMAITDYRFGSNARITLSSWRPPQDLKTIDSHDITLKPHTRAALGADPQRVCRHRLSPAGDEALHTRLHDPPAVDGYRVLVLRQLDSGAGRDLAHLPIAGGEALIGPNETIVYGDGDLTRQIDPWTGDELRRWPVAGEHLAQSADGRYLFADGRLYDGDAEVARLPAATDEALFTATGMLLRRGEQLLALRGLEPASAETRPRPELERLRAWRSRGLINHDDYLRLKEAIP